MQSPDLHGRSGGPVRTIAVTSGKGGVGKTNLSVNLAVALAHAGERVALLDADLGLANVDVVLGLTARRNLSHVLAGECRLEDIVMPGPADTLIIPGSSGLAAMADLDHTAQAGLIHAFDALGEHIDTLLVDTGAGINRGVLGFCAAAEHVVVVVCDEPASINDAYALIKVLATDRQVATVHVLANMVSGSEHGRRLYNSLARVVDRFLCVDLRYLGAVPADPMLRAAVRQRRAFIDAYPLSKAALAVRDMAARLAGWPAAGVASGRLQFFMHRLVGESGASTAGLV